MMCQNSYRNLWEGGGGGTKTASGLGLYVIISRLVDSSLLLIYKRSKILLEKGLVGSVPLVLPEFAGRLSELSYICGNLFRAV
jgi:hypothetical protein